ncbi:IclR family transcriptional regulator [Lentibacillus salinarum]|uniref:IclR family transcriptional regulator n=1 Tax=Lentibacillus salinarum TaxID=446820 RepID=A0ABW3ZZX0_9BACI
MAEKDSSQTGDRLLSLLECFTEEKPAWGVTELSRELGLYKSIVHRMIKTLERRGYLKQNVYTKNYSLDLKVFELGMIVSRRMDLRNVAVPVIEELWNKTNETIILEIANENEGLCIDIKESTQGIKCTSQLGKRVPLYSGAPTKVLMAYLPPEDIEDVIDKGLKRFTPNTVTEPEKLKSQLKTIRDQGYSITNGELDEGSLSIAFPIKRYSGEVVASISIVGPEFRVQNQLEEYTQYCKEAAGSISQELGFIDPQYTKS